MMTMIMMMIYNDDDDDDNAYTTWMKKSNNKAVLSLLSNVFLLVSQPIKNYDMIHLKWLKNCQNG